MEALTGVTAEMAAAGIRRLLVLSGDAQWSSQQAQRIAGMLPGDWLWVGAAPEMALNCAPAAIRTLLGQEFRHAVFDARNGLDAAALAALAGTLTAGSWLLLLTPPWDSWPGLPDEDACRWNDSQQPLLTPNFIHHLQRTLAMDHETVCWRQHQPLTLPDFTPRPDWQPASGEPDAEQAQLLTRLGTIKQGVAVVTAPRGRGKSALAGMLIKWLPGRALVTAPSRAACEVIARHAGERFNFIAPDALLENPPSGYDWLVVDEAAALPAPQLRQLVSVCPAALLTTTVQGYEGTGRGFLLKFCASLPQLHYFTLNTPIRWATGDPLEQLVERALLFQDDDFSVTPTGAVTISNLPQTAWQQAPQQAAALYRLLCGAHYRTSPLDLRRIMDAPGQQLIAACSAQGTVGALWLVAEGGLSAALSKAIWAGRRRPRGNLVAQSLAAHGSDPLAATLKGWRVSRIAVHPGRQREGIGQRLIAEAGRQASGYDYLSVSFGFTPQLWQFWQRCGFTLVRVGTHREASSGCYSALALLALSPAGQRLLAQEAERWQRNQGWLQPWIAAALPPAQPKATTLNDVDWQELAGFAWAHRPAETTIGSLQRLLLASPLPLLTLRSWLQQGLSAAALCQRLGFSGRKALLAAQRQEAALALSRLDPPRAGALQSGILQW